MRPVSKVFFDRLAVEHGQRAGQAEADGAGVRVGRVAEGSAAGAEHLGLGFDLAVDFEADGDEVGHGKKFAGFQCSVFSKMKIGPLFRG